MIYPWNLLAIELTLTSIFYVIDISLSAAIAFMLNVELSLSTCVLIISAFMLFADNNNSIE